MFESPPGDQPHQSLQLRHLDDGPSAERLQGIVGKTAFTDIGRDAAVPIVGRDAPERDGAARRAAGPSMFVQGSGFRVLQMHDSRDPRPVQVHNPRDLRPVHPRIRAIRFPCPDHVSAIRVPSKCTIRVICVPFIHVSARSASRSDHVSARSASRPEYANLQSRVPS